MNTVPPHAYSGARAMVELHEIHMRRFLDTWQRAKDADLAMPSTDDPDYESLAHLLHHVLGCARHYMIWMCDTLGLPAPEIAAAPDVAHIEAAQAAYADQVFLGWRTPLAETPERRFNEVQPSAWGVDYCIDAMLEHAVMHPIRHTYQLERMLAATD